LSNDGKRIITASDGKGSLMKLWKWSQPATDADKPKGCNNKSFSIALGHQSLFCVVSDSFELPEKFDRVQSIRFSCNESDLETFVVTSRNGIAFGQWVCVTNF
jgi:hypothetical protein